ncbi:hypothetical protein LTS18_008439, partial [Coniosporium uncinatum]
MHTFTVFTLLTTTVLAKGFSRVSSPSSLFARQAIDPSESSGSGDTCADAFGEGYVICAPETDTALELCYNPDLGEICCENTWACPDSYFCLVDPYCCPD